MRVTYPKKKCIYIYEFSLFLVLWIDNMILWWLCSMKQQILVLLILVSLIQTGYLFFSDTMLIFVKEF